MAGLSAIDAFRTIGARTLRVKPFVYPSQWIAENALLSEVLSGTGNPAPFNVWHFPWNVGIVDAFAEGKRGILVKKAVQVAVSYYMQMFLLYLVARFGGPMAYSMAKDDTMRKHVLDRIDTNLRRSPELVELYLPKRGDHSTTLGKRFLNATVEFFGAGSELNFKSNPYKYALADEFEQMGVFPDGSDAVGLFLGRQAAFSDPFFAGWSTPGEAESARGIEVAVMSRSDIRLPYWRCPHCSDAITVNILDNVKFDKDSAGRPVAASARLVCPHCGRTITDSQRATQMVKACQAACPWYDAEPYDAEVGWKTTLSPAEAAKREYAGFDGLDHLHNPRKRVSEIAVGYCAIVSESDKKTYWNDVLGKGYTIKARQLSRDSIEDIMAEARRDVLPPNLLWVSFGADLQHAGPDLLKSMFYYDISAWCWVDDPDGQSRFIRKVTLFKDRITSTEADGHKTIKTLLRSWTMADAKGHQHGFNIAVIDSTHRTKVVNAICNALCPSPPFWAVPVIYGTVKTGDPDYRLEPQNEEVGDPSHPFLLTTRNYAVGTYVSMLADPRGLVELPHGIGEVVIQHYLANECIREPDSRGVMVDKWVKRRDSTGIGGHKGRALDDDFFAAGVYSMLGAFQLGYQSEQASSIGEAQAEADRIADGARKSMLRPGDTGAARRARLSARLHRRG